MMRGDLGSILIFGFGSSGGAAATAAAGIGAEVLGYDDAITPGDLPQPHPEGLDEFLAAGGKLLSRRQAASGSFILCVVNPAVPLDHELCRDLEGRGVSIVSEIEFGWMICEAPIAAITGTNGKSTTTALAATMLSASGITAHAGGNISAEGWDAPLSSIAPKAGPSDAVVAEVSNLQLARCYEFHPKAAALLNITADHLDKHSTLDHYVAVKARIFQNHTKGDFAVLNLEDPAVRRLAESVPSHKLWFSDKSEAFEEGAFIRDGVYVLRSGGAESIICGIDETGLWTVYDRLNILAAACVAFSMGASIDGIRQGAISFAGLPDRMELAGQIGGIPWYNSSMCTNEAAGIAAATALAERYRPIIISGGSDKGLDYDEWGRQVASLSKALLLVEGSGTHRLLDAARSAGVSQLSIHQSLGDAMSRAREIAEPGDAVILAPATASFGEFKDFRARGRFFRERISQMQQDKENVTP